MIKLTPRLMLVASLVGNCKRLVDVGTDHAYIPAYLVENGVAEKAIASDINPNPLKNAQCTLNEENISDFVELRLSDGLKNISPDEAEEIVIAGMGGIMIAGMIENTLWLKDKSKHLVLQPMTHFEDVRQALQKNGFEITEEKTVAEGKHIYLVISAVFSGNVSEKPPYWYYVGSLINSNSETDKMLVAKTLKSLKKRCDGLEKSGQNYSELLELIRSVENAECN